MKQTKNNINLENFESDFDMLHLPSQGLFYPNKNSSLLIKYLTAREENILTSPALAENGRALKMVLDSVIIDKDICVDDLLVADKDAIILFLRSTAYGDTFPLEFECVNCGKKVETPFKISSLESIDLTRFPNEKGEYEYELPISKKKIKFKPLRVAEEVELEKLIESKKKYVYNTEFKESITLRYLSQLTEFDGNTDKKQIESLIKKMPLKDSISLRTYIEKNEPGINKKISLKCPMCLTEYYDTLRIGSEFLGLQPEYKQNIKEEIFLLGYYGKGISRDSALRMSVSDRRWNIQRISEEIEKKNKAEEDASKKANSKNSSSSTRFG